MSNAERLALRPAQDQPEGSNTQLNFSSLSASGQARQHNGNVYNNTNYTYTLRKRRSDDTLHENERNRVFLTAVAEGQRPRVSYLLKRGVDLDHCDDEGFTALHHACISGFEDVVQVLLDAGADVNAQSFDLGTPLCLAALRGRENVVKMLIEYRASVNKAALWVGTPLHCACYIGSLDLAKILLAHGADMLLTASVQFRLLAKAREFGSPGARTRSRTRRHGLYEVVDCQPFFLAAYKGRAAVVNHFIEIAYPVDTTSRIWHSKNPTVETFESTSDYKLGDYTALMIASGTGNLKVVSRLIAANASVNAKNTSGATGIHIATSRVDFGNRKGHIACAQKLIEAGAELDAEYELTMKLLFIALKNNRTDVVSFIAKQGGDVPYTDRDGNTACHVAASEGHSEHLKALLSNGASALKRNDHGQTPLHVAVQKGNLATIECLLEHGANPGDRDNDGTTILMTAMKHNDIRIIKLLLEARADVKAKDRHNRNAACSAVKCDPETQHMSASAMARARTATALPVHDLIRSSEEVNGNGSERASMEVEVGSSTDE